MASSLFVRTTKWRLKLALARLLMANKPGGAHFALVGAGSADQLCQRVIDAGHTRVLVVTDKPLRELGIADRALSALSASGATLHWFDGVMPDPTYSQIKAGAEVRFDNSCTAVVAVGGGSSMDAAKIIAAFDSPQATPEDWVGVNQLPEGVLPIYAIPTTAGTGSEATIGAVVTDETEHSKRIIAGADLLPRAVALDAELMLGLPPMITAATGLDALTHGVEAFISVFERGTRAETARMAVKGVFRWLPQVMADPGDRDARQGMAIAAYYGGVAINQVNVGNVHAIAHQLGANYGIPHGMANALVLPHVLRIYADDAAPRLALLADAIGLEAGASESGKAAAFIDAIEALRESVGLLATHPDIKVEDHAGIIEAAIDEGDGYFSPRLLTRLEVQGLLSKITVRAA